MGVPGLTSWLYANYSTFSVSTVAQGGGGQQRSFDHIHFDMNSFLHEVIKKGAKNTEEVMADTVSAVMEVLDILRPLKSLSFCYDGPTPHAKILHQRQRRLRQSELEQQITPGSTLMYEVEEGVTKSVAKRLSWCPELSVVLSGCGVPEEGEIKIAQRIAQCAAVEGPNPSHCVIGCDSDLFLICTAAVSCVNISWYSPFFEKRLLCCGSVFRSWIDANSIPDLKFLETLRSLRLDFVALALFAGNDYFGEVSGYSVGGSWGAYLKGRAEGGEWGLTRVHPTNYSIGLCKANLAAFLRYLYPALNTVGSSELEYAPYVVKYLKSVAWSLTTLSQGRCPSFGFVNDKFTPAVRELVLVLESADETIHKGRWIRAPPERPGSGPLLPLVHYCLVIRNKNLLPTAVWKAQALSTESFPSDIAAAAEEVAQCFDEATATKREKMKLSFDVWRSCTPRQYKALVPLEEVTKKSASLKGNNANFLKFVPSVKGPLASKSIHVKSEGIEQCTAVAKIVEAGSIIKRKKRGREVMAPSTLSMSEEL